MVVWLVTMIVWASVSRRMCVVPPSAPVEVTVHVNLVESAWLSCVRAAVYDQVPPSRVPLLASDVVRVGRRLDRAGRGGEPRLADVEGRGRAVVAAECLLVRGDELDGGGARDHENEHDDQRPEKHHAVARGDALPQRPDRAVVPPIGDSHDLW